ncbi:hypothetical protein [Streptomyces shenzhenensis]|uniref:hypothetical protein n=1 Tax=Streptomyces shenzhenensis TaxID=943815 RepID=UPI0033D88B4C
MHQPAVEGEGDGLSGQVVRDLVLLAAEADIAVASDDTVELDHERGLSLVGPSGGGRHGTGNAPAALHERFQIGRGESGGTDRASAPSMKT